MRITIPHFSAAKMFRCNAKTEVKIYVEPFDDAGEIQVVPIDTVVGDGGCNLETDDVGRDQTQGCGARGYKSKDTSMCSRQRWREPDIVA